MQSAKINPKTKLGAIRSEKRASKYKPSVGKCEVQYSQNNSKLCVHLYNKSKRGHIHDYNILNSYLIMSVYF